jgi:hypothetical protein
VKPIQPVEASCLDEVLLELRHSMNYSPQTAPRSLDQSITTVLLLSSFTAALESYSMSLLGMPWAMLNLGCEMVYILHQRLNAQGIPAEKSAKVLQDIIKTMLEPGFLADKLFVAQDMYSLASTRKVFDKIAHSSIMKLSQNRWDFRLQRLARSSSLQFFDKDADAATIS